MNKLLRLLSSEDARNGEMCALPAKLRHLCQLIERLIRIRYCIVKLRIETVHSLATKDLYTFWPNKQRPRLSQIGQTVNHQLSLITDILRHSRSFSRLEVVVRSFNRGVLYWDYEDEV